MCQHKYTGTIQGTGTITIGNRDVINSYLQRIPAVPSDSTGTIVAVL